MALKGRVFVTLDEDDGRDLSRRDRRFDADSDVTVIRRSRPGPRPATEAEKLERKWAAWVLMRQAGMTFREISEATGHSVSTIHEGVTKGMDAARKALQRRRELHGL